MKSHPIYYKTIPVQFAFLLTEDGEKVRVRIKQVTSLGIEKEFKTLKEAKQFIKNIKVIL